MHPLGLREQGAAAAAEEASRRGHHHRLAGSRGVGGHLQQAGPGEVLPRAQPHGGLGRVCSGQVRGPAPAAVPAAGGRALHGRPPRDLLRDERRPGAAAGAAAGPPALGVRAGAEPGPLGGGPAPAAHAEPGRAHRGPHRARGALPVQRHGRPAVPGPRGGGGAGRAGGAAARLVVLPPHQELPVRAPAPRRRLHPLRAGRLLLRRRPGGRHAAAPAGPGGGLPEGRGAGPGPRPQQHLRAAPQQALLPAQAHQAAVPRVRLGHHLQPAPAGPLCEGGPAPQARLVRAARDALQSPAPRDRTAAPPQPPAEPPQEQDGAPPPPTPCRAPSPQGQGQDDGAPRPPPAEPPPGPGAGWQHPPAHPCRAPSPGAGWWHPTPAHPLQSPLPPKARGWTAAPPRPPPAESPPPGAGRLHPPAHPLQSPLPQGQDGCTPPPTPAEPPPGPGPPWSLAQVGSRGEGCSQKHGAVCKGGNKDALPARACVSACGDPGRGEPRPRHGIPGRAHTPGRQRAGGLVGRAVGLPLTC